MSTQGKLTLRNYRCFDWEHPVVLEFDRGFSAFIGPNNSGKSTALRSIYELRQSFVSLPQAFQAGSGFRTNFQPLGTSDLAELANDAAPSRFQIELEIINPQPAPDPSHSVALKVVLEYDILQQSLYAKQLVFMSPNGDKNHWGEAEVKLAQGNSGNFIVHYQNGTIIDYSGLREFGITLNESKYFPAFRNAINEGAGNYYDLPVGTALVATWDQWKAGNSRAQQNAISKVEKEIALLLGFNNLQINADQSGKTLNVNIDGRPQKLHEVGAGVAQLIIVLAAALVNRPPYILIDEPELSLHPALQLSFLATLGSYARYGLLYSTHSISLARSSAQRIYAVRKISNGLSEIHPYGDKAINFGSWLGELSYSSRVDLGCEGLLLVEGTTEILCFQEYLRKLKKDHKYVLIQLGGSSLIRGGVTPHLSELSRIINPSKIRVFIDSEKESADAPLASDRVAFVTDCKGIGIKGHV